MLAKCLLSATGYFMGVWDSHPLDYSFGYNTLPVIWPLYLTLEQRSVHMGSLQAASSISWGSIFPRLQECVRGRIKPDQAVILEVEGDLRVT